MNFAKTGISTGKIKTAPRNINTMCKIIDRIGSLTEVVECFTWLVQVFTGKTEYRKNPDVRFNG